MMSNITTYERHLDKAQLKCVDLGVKAPKSKKVHIYVQQMYGANILTKKEFIEWEGTKEDDKKWAEAKTFFGALYKECRSNESNMKAHRSSFETANSFTQNPRNGSEQSMTELITDISAAKATTKSPTNKWVEYSDSLEYFLLEAKEFTATSTSRAEADQTIIMEELKEQRKQTQLALDQNTKLMDMLAKSGMGGEATDSTRNQGKKKKAERTCKNC